MRRSIIVLVLLIICSEAKGQTITQQLLDLEYAFFEAESVEAKNDALIGKIDLYLMRSELNEQVLYEMRRVVHEALPLEERVRFYWNASLAFYLHRKSSRALHYLELYQSLDTTGSAGEKMLEYLCYASVDREIAEKKFAELLVKDSSLTCLDCIEGVMDYELPLKQFRIVMSLFVPGFGTASAGKPVKGMLSLALNALTVMTIVYTVQQQLWVNTVSWGTNLLGKFYVGNIRLADKTIQDKELRKKKELAKDCELQINAVLQRYSLAFIVTQ